MGLRWLVMVRDGRGERGKGWVGKESALAVIEVREQGTLM